MHNKASMIQTLPKKDLSFIFDQLSHLFNTLDKQHIFITGATGWIGSWLLETLIYIAESSKLNLKISILTRNKKKFAKNFPYLYKSKILEVKEGDLSKSKFKLKIKSIDYIIHAATDTNHYLEESHALLTADTIVEGTRKVLDLCLENNVKKILFLSSGAIYGQMPLSASPFRETDIFSPNPNDIRSAYGEAKRYAELLCVMYYKKFSVPYTTARCFSFIGPRLPLNTHYAIGNFLKNILDKQEVIIHSDGKSLRSYMYMADLVIWLLTLLFIGKNGEVYNVGSDIAYSIQDIVQVMMKSVKAKNNYKIMNKSISDSYYIPNIQKARKDLNLEIYHTIENAITKTYHWYQEISKK